jgi:hypothetical protein
MRDMYIQTEMERPIADGSPGREVLMSFIPAELAVPGLIIDLKDPETDEWTRGWKVLENGGEQIAYVAYERANFLSQQHKSQAVASDITRGSREKMKKKRH